MSQDLGTELPAALRPPVGVMLAKAAEQIPGPSSMRGGAVYEMKWDGFRLVVVRDQERTSLWSRQGKDLTAHFPDIAAAAAAQVPPGTVVDGEVVLWAGERLDFSGLTRRLTTSPKAIAALAHRHPASYVAFDLLAAGGRDLRTRPWTERREHLERLAAGWAPPLNLTPSTTDVALAAAWLAELAVVGIEGVVAKPAAGTYRPGARDWVKVKHRAALDVVCAAVIGPLAGPRIVVAGLTVGGRLRIVGRSVPLSDRAAKDLGRHLRAAAPGHPWPTQVTSATVNGFGSERDPITLTLIEPVVVEVSADVAWSGTSFRHPLRCLRLRPDLEPGDVTAPRIGH